MNLHKDKGTEGSSYVLECRECCHSGHPQLASDVFYAVGVPQWPRTDLLLGGLKSVACFGFQAPLNSQIQIMECLKCETF